VDFTSFSIKKNPFSPQKAACGRDSGHVKAPINVNGLTGDIPRGLTDQKCHRGGNIFRGSQARQWYLGAQSATLIIPKRSGHVGIDKTRSNTIHRDRP
jgi:hypothetical protein